MFKMQELQELYAQSPNKQQEPVSLDVRYGTHQIKRLDKATGCKVRDEVKLRSYNGKLLGPTIERRPGDMLLVSLSNHLPEQPHPPAQPPGGEHGDDHDPGHGHGTEHEQNTTNLHVHGLHVSPAGNSDNILLKIRPGEHFHYEIPIPSDHPAGTYWYHAHNHGSVTLQLASGLAGPLIIRGDIDKVPAIKAAKERILLFQQITYLLGIQDPEDPSKTVNGLELPPDDDAPFRPGAWAAAGLYFTINGEVQPEFEMRPGAVERWRFIHAGIHEVLNVRLVPSQAPQATVLPQYQIAHDGITTGRLDKVETTELYPGSRTDVLVSATDEHNKPLKAGTYLLMNVEPDPDLPADDDRRILARIKVKGPPVKQKLPTEQELQPLAPFKTLQEQEVKGTQTVEFSTSFVPGQPVVFLINGKPFDPKAPPLPLKLGRVEKWIIRSLDKPVGGFPGLVHVFHIHVNPFQIKTPDGKLVWRDTILLRPGESTELITRYKRYIGVFAMHCHIPIHEDLGMMQLVEVKEGESNHVPAHG